MRTFAAPITVAGVKKDPDGVTFTMSPGKMKLTVCSDSIVRVLYSPTATLPAGQDFAVTDHSWRAASFKVADASGKLTVSTRQLKVAVDKATGAVTCFDASGNLLLGEPAGGGKTMTAVTVNGESSWQSEPRFTCASTLEGVLLESDFRNFGVAALLRSARFIGEIDVPRFGKVRLKRVVAFGQQALDT